MSASAQGQPQRKEAQYERVPKRTPMACVFCRARKMKCDGGKPTCTHCNKRQIVCSYVPVPKEDK